MKYVLIEGIDGSGKSTIARHIYTKAAHRVDAHSIFEPTEGSYGAEARRRIDTGEYESLSELFDLFLNDRKINFSRVITPYLKQGRMIVQDRGFLSSAAYQSSNLNEVSDLIDRHAKEEWFRFPDQLIFLDCDPVKAVQRLTERGKTASVDKIDTLSSLRYRYLHALKTVMRGRRVPSIAVIDTTDESLDTSLRRAWGAVSHDIPTR